MKMQYGILALCIVFEATALQASQRSEGAEGIGGSIAVTRQAARLWIQTFMGGPLSDGMGVAVDKSGYIYVTGDTMARDFSPLVNPLQPKSGKDSCTVGPRALGYPQDAFVAKLSPWGGLVYSTFLGGDGFDAGRAIAADDEGNAYVVGNTSSANFPTVNPLQGAIRDWIPFEPGDCNSTKDYGGDAFLAKINPDGSALLFSTYLGGILDEAALGVAVDGAGNVLVSGRTESPDFPVRNLLQPVLHGYRDGFVVKVNAAGTELVYSTFVGGSGEESAAGVAIDANGNAYVTGGTTSPDFPSTEAMQPFGGYSDAFVLKLNATGDTLLYSTWLGGTGADSGKAIAADHANNACVAGETASINFPIVDPFQRSNAGNADAFVARITDPYSAKSCFAQFADGQGISSTLILVNPSATITATGTAELFDSSGRPLSVDINGTIQQGSFPFSIPPAGVGFYATAGAGERAVGSLQVSSNPSIGGTILFSGDLGVAGVGSAQMTAKSLVPIESDVSRGMYTGVAIANPYSTALSLTLSLLDLQGNTIAAGAVSMLLPAHGQLARFPEEIFSGRGIDFSRFRGTLKVESPLSVSAMAIQARPGQIATLPVTPIEGGSQKLYFAHFANGQGMASILILVNPSLTRTAHGTARFFSSDGSPLVLGLNGGTQSASLDFTLQPLGAAFYSTDGSGDLTAGSVEVSADVALGGSIIFAGSDGLAGVGAAQPAATFLVPIESDSAKQIYTGVAISNPADSAVDVSLLLHDSGGAPVKNGSVLLTLPAKGHTARFVEELYEGKGINLAASRGVLEVISPIPINGMALRATPHEYATLPVTTVK
jgi:hypothetical protein